MKHRSLLRLLGITPSTHAIAAEPLKSKCVWARRWETLANQRCGGGGRQGDRVRGVSVNPLSARAIEELLNRGQPCHLVYPPPLASASAFAQAGSHVGRWVGDRFAHFPSPTAWPGGLRLLHFTSGFTRA